jgi:hypothetical protein
VDILTNAVRRALTGNLQREGWQNFHRLMIHENDGPYISFVLFSESGDIIHTAPYTGRERGILKERKIDVDQTQYAASLDC